MRPFEYAAPTSLQEALATLAQANGQAKPLVGGTDLIAQMKERRVSPRLVLDVKHIPDMAHLEYREGAGLRIGAAVTCTDVAEYGPVNIHYRALAQACRLVGSTQIQNRASVGGNICNAAPSADTAPALLVYDATAVVAGPQGQREVPLAQFFVGPGETVLVPQELLVEVVVPPPPPNSASSYLRFTPREEMDIAVAGVGSLVALDPATQRCVRARIALGAVAPTPLLAREAEEVLEGQVLTEEVVREAGERAAAASRPITDVRGSAEYRRELIKVLTRRTLAQCLQQLTP